MGNSHNATTWSRSSYIPTVQMKKLRHSQQGASLSQVICLQHLGPQALGDLKDMGRWSSRSQMSSRLTQQGTRWGNWQSQKMVSLPELRPSQPLSTFCFLVWKWCIFQKCQNSERSVVIKWIGCWLSILIYPISDCQSAFSYNKKCTKLALLVLTTTKKVYQLRVPVKVPRFQRENWF